LVGSHLFLSTRDYEAQWRVAGSEFDAASPLTHLRLPSITLPHNVDFPVTLSFVVDGREVAQDRKWGPDFEVYHSASAPPPPWAGPAKPRRGYPGVEMDVEPAAVPSLLGAKDAELTATSAGGELIGTIPLTLPDWGRLAVEARSAFVNLEAQRMRSLCQKRTNISIQGH
jgi:hypothetical protein